MKLTGIAKSLPGMIAFLLFFGVAANSPASANTGNASTTALTDPNKGDSWNIRNNWGLRNKAGRVFFPQEAGGSDVVQNGESQGPGTVNHSTSGPVQMWPVQIPTLQSSTPSMKDQGILKNMMRTTGFPLSDTQFQIIERMNQNIETEQQSDPERNMWQSTAQSGMQAGSAANSAAGMTTNQGQSAIQFQEKFLVNFTSEAGNRWLLIRDRLFIPIAVLLLLPGAVLCQVKAIVAQGSNVLGETSPFEGIFRSIIAIFMIPGTLLVINYGIDVSNSIHFTIADEYTRIFGTDMYHDAQCALWRAFPVNAQQSNKNAIRPGGQDNSQPQGQSSFSGFEALDLDVRQYDPCAGLDKSLVADEDQKQSKLISRLAINGTNVGLTATWNILCAFQEAFLFYLFCMGPIAAALWVWPVKSLRGALPSWVEGVIILCFWSLFWNTVVLLMACFRGVSDTGTVIMTALNFLSTIVTNYAFDFVGLVTNGASQGVQQAMQKAASSASHGGGGKGSGGGPGGSHHQHHGAPNAHGTAQNAANQAAQHPTNSALTTNTANRGPAPGANTPHLGPDGKPIPPGLSQDNASGTPTRRGLEQSSAPPGSATDPHDKSLPQHIPTSGPPDSKSATTGDPSQMGIVPAGLAINDPSKTGQHPNSGLHVDKDGNLSVNGAKPGEHLTPEQQKQLADQLKAVQDHDADKLRQLAGPNADPNGLQNLANSNLSAATLSAMSNNGSGLAIGANGELINASTGEALKVGGTTGFPPGGMDIGGAPSGLAPAPGGEAIHLQAGQDYGSVHASQLNGLAKDAHISPNDMTALVGPNGTDIVGPNGQPLGHIGQDGQLCAPGTNGQVVMDMNGNWTAASTGTPLAHEGNNWHVADAQNPNSAAAHIGFDPSTGNFNVNGQAMSGTEFAKNTPEGVYAHVPQQTAGEFHKPEALTTGLPADVNPNVAFSAQSVGQEATPGSPMQGLTGLAQSEGYGTYAYNVTGGQLYADAGGHHIAHYDAQHQTWVATDAQGHDTHAVLNHGQYDQTGQVAQSTHGQWIDSASPGHTLQTDSSGHWQFASAGTAGSYSAMGYDGGAIAPASGQPLGDMSPVQQHSFQQLAQQEGLQAPHLTSDGHHVVANDSHGVQHLIASEQGGQWVASQHSGTADVVMNSSGQWVAPGSSTPLTAHDTGSGNVTWSAQGAPDVHYNPQTHMMEASGYTAPAASVTPDMVQNIQHSHSPEILASTGNAGQQLQAMASQEGAGQVHMQYDSQHHLQAVGDSGQVVANYNSAEHRWEAAGSGGSVYQNQAGDWVTNNSSVNQMAAAEHVGQVHVQADGHGGFQAVGSGGQTVANYDSSTGGWTPAQVNSGVQHLADQMHAGPVHMQTHAAPDGTNVVQAVGQNGQVVASYDTTNQRWETSGGSVVQDNSGNWVANNQYVNTAQETPVQYSPQVSYTDPSGQSQGSWTVQGAPEIGYNQGNFTAYSSSGQPDLVMPANNMTPDMVNYVHQNPQQIEGLQNLAQQEHLQGPVQIQTSEGGQIQAMADGQSIAHYEANHWVADHSQNHVVERNDGQWVTSDSSHTPVETHDGHHWAAQQEQQMPSSPPTSQPPHGPTIASTGFGSGATALGAWGAMKRQSSQQQSGNQPTKPDLPAPPASAQNTEFTPQEGQLNRKKKKKNSSPDHPEYIDPDVV
ncbi:MAG TPA: hypothetical protein V6C86_08805 [Oculatellaceae cyanobacterium]